MSGDAVARARSWVTLGSVALLVATSSAVAASDGDVRIRRLLAVRSVAESVSSVALTGSDRVPVTIEAQSLAPADDQMALTVGATLAAMSIALAPSLVDFAPSVPDVRDPLPGEVRGTVNLARNPSLEYAGLLDWTAEAGITLDLDAIQAWDGARSALATVATGSELPRVIVASRPALGLSGARSWIGAIAVFGDGDPVRPSLRLVYEDGTDDEGLFEDQGLYDEGELFWPDGSWRRLETAGMDQNAAKVLTRVDLFIELPQGASERLVGLDGAQIEEDRGEGATAYADGDQGAGHRWHGTEGFSVSVREPMGVVS